MKKQKRPTDTGIPQKRPTDTGIPEVRTSVKRDLLYYRGQRDLLYRQKRPTIEAQETYDTGKRDLL